MTARKKTAKKKARKATSKKASPKTARKATSKKVSRKTARKKASPRKRAAKATASEVVYNDLRKMLPSSLLKLR